MAFLSWISCTCRGKGEWWAGPGASYLHGCVLVQPLTSSSGFSSPSAACSSGTFRRRRVLAGFLRRMEPRDSSVMLWICAREVSKKGIGAQEGLAGQSLA